MASDKNSSKKTGTSKKPVVRVSRKALWIGRDKEEGLDVEIHRNKPRHVRQSYGSLSYNRLASKGGLLHDMCAAGFERATGIKLKPGQIAKLTVTLTFP